jgi:hypothetical protein
MTGEWSIDIERRCADFAFQVEDGDKRLVDLPHLMGRWLVGLNRAIVLVRQGEKPRVGGNKLAQDIDGLRAQVHGYSVLAKSKDMLVEWRVKKLLEFHRRRRIYCCLVGISMLDVIEVFI